jgi:hydroxymethylpyrimidine/phosphomethylpyrimidine kinase
MVATSGDRLIRADAVDRLRARLLPLADLLTPNLPEAAALLDEEIATDEAGMLDQGRRLLALGPRAVLMKGGHASGPESADLLVTAAEWRRLAAPRRSTPNTHGTGCTLSSAAAAGLALGLPLAEATAQAKTYLTAALAAGDELGIGGGSGPVHHFHAWWPARRTDP